MTDFPMPKLHQDKARPGIVRFEGADDLTGILAGMHAAEIVHRCNAFSRLEAALENIAKQHTIGELSEAGEDCEGDFEGAYDTIIELARKALNPPAPTEQA